MSELLVAVHSALRWLVLAALLVGGAYALLQTPRRAPFRRSPFTLGAAVVDLQVVLGVALYVLNEGWRQNLFIAVIHPAFMLTAAAVVHVGTVRARRGGLEAWRAVGVTFLLALILVALAIPWQR